MHVRIQWIPLNTAVIAALALYRSVPLSSFPILCRVFFPFTLERITCLSQAVFQQTASYSQQTDFCQLLFAYHAVRSRFFMRSATRVL